MNPHLSDTSMRSLISPVRLAKGDATNGTDAIAGTVFYKQLFTYGTWANPLWWWDGEATMELTKELAEIMVENFNNNTLGSKVPVPRNHTDDVNANTGEVVKLEAGADGLYGYLEIRDPKTVEDINNGLIFDVSIGFDWDYVSQKDNSHHGATLFHVALVNTPYINNMTGFSETELAKNNHEYATHLTVGGQRSVIMMSISKVEELKAMNKKTQLAKIVNDHEADVEVTITDEAGKETKQTLKPQEEIEVTAAQAAAVQDTITKAKEDAKVEAEAAEAARNAETGAERVAREKREKKEADELAAKEAADAKGDDGLTDEERQTAAKKEADEAAAAEAKAKEDKKTGDDVVVPEPKDDEVKETPEQELARLRREKSELSAEKEYERLSKLGKILPAQKDLFMSIAQSDTKVTLSADHKELKLTKGQSTSVTTMLSAILEAGPQLIKLSEQGSGKVEGADGKVELTQEIKDKLTKYGFSVEKFERQLAAGTITLEDLN